ncbi:hypothetical protein GCM10023161_34050 [Mycobacterium paraffinicum]|uniref:Uncharacterized protein n=1 Tax=Mycobacterium paraffinicum TaxID=53378 RepID=A0ABP8EZ61_9MYCO
MVGQLRAVSIRRTHPVTLAGPAARADPVVPAARADLPVVPAARADLPVGRVDQADPVTRADLRVDPAGPIIRAVRAVRVDLVDLVALVALVAPVDPIIRAGPGTEMPSAATSAVLRGVTGRHLGGPASRRGPRGIGRSPRPARSGGMARSTTGATRRLPCGIPDSISGASGSLESGFRCKQR